MSTEDKTLQTIQSLEREAHSEFRAGHLLKSAQLSERIFEISQDPMLGFNTACLYAEVKEPTRGLAMLSKAVKAGYLDIEKMEYQPELQPVRELSGWVELKGYAKAANQRLEARIERPELRRELLSMWVKDQRVQRAWNAVSELRRDQPDSAEVRSKLSDLIGTRQRHNARLRQIIRNAGWPSVSKVAVDGSNRAWALVQHADNDIALQRKAVRLMSAAVQRKNVSPVEFAELSDRYARNVFALQVYGMAIKRDGKSGNQFYPIKDEQHLNARRRKLGLEPAADYARRNGFEYRIPTGNEAKRRTRVAVIKCQREVKRALEAFHGGRYADMKDALETARRSHYLSTSDLYRAAKMFGRVAMANPSSDWTELTFQFLELAVLRDCCNRKALELPEFQALRHEARWERLQAEANGQSTSEELY